MTAGFNEKGLLIVHDLATGKVALHREHDGPYRDGRCLLGFSPDGRWLAGIVENDEFVLFDLHNSFREVRLPGRYHLARYLSYASLAFSADGGFFAIAGFRGCLILVWDVLDATQIREISSGSFGSQYSWIWMYSNPEAPLLLVAFSPDASRLFVGRRLLRSPKRAEYCRCDAGSMS